MLKSWLLWVLTLLLALALLFFSDVGYALALFILTLVLPLLLIGLNQLVARRIEVSFKLPEVAAKERQFNACLHVFNGRRLPLSPLRCSLSCKNILTGEDINPEVFFSLAARAKQSINFILQSQYCGCLQLKVTSLRVYDVFGLVPVRLKPGVLAEVIVLPDTFPLHLTVATHLAKDIEADEFSQTKAGFDPSETFAIREYEPGDSLQRIHWKLSSKFEEILIKEPSLPVQRSFLVLLETGLPADTDLGPDIRDALFEIMLSVCQQMTEEQLSFEVAWQEAEGFFRLRINSFDELAGLANKLLRLTYESRAQNALQVLNETEGLAQFEHLLYIAPTVPDDLVALSADTMLTAIICQCSGDQTEIAADNINLYFCSPDNYQIELSNLTI